MKTLKLFTALLGAFSLFATATYAQTQQGQIQAFMVRGTVTITNNVTGETTPLARGQVISENYTIKTQNESTVLLLFSNGSSLALDPNTSLNLETYKQAPYDKKKGSFLTLKEDPSQSKINAFLNYGLVIGEARKLQPGSEFIVNTPNGSAGIRGTTFIVSYINGITRITNVNGNVQYTVSENTFNLPEGQYITIQGTTDQNGNVVLNTSNPQPATEEDISKAEEFQGQVQQAEASQSGDGTGTVTPIIPVDDVDTSIISPS